MRSHADRCIRRASVTLAFVLAALGAGCAGERPLDRYRVTFEVYSDLLPLPGAQISVRSHDLARTDAEGAARLELTGHDGTVIPVIVRCPAGTRGPEAAIEVTLRTLQVIDQTVAARGIVQRVNCPPEDRTVAVVVRTNGRPGIPIVWQGREISRTDTAGVASLTFRVHPAQPIQLALATTDFPTLRPQSPTGQFLAPDADDVFVWTQDFEEAAPVRPRGGGRHVGGGGGGGVHMTHGGGGAHRIIRIR